VDRAEELFTEIHVLNPDVIPVQTDGPAIRNIRKARLADVNRKTPDAVATHHMENRAQLRRATNAHNSALFLRRPRLFMRNLHG
jgi:hypothetical protein